MISILTKVIFSKTESIGVYRKNIKLEFKWFLKYIKLQKKIVLKCYKVDIYC